MATLKMKLKELEEIEKDVATALQSAGQACQELSREKISMKQVESNTSTFLKTLQNVENGLTKHIIYLTQVSTGEAIFVGAYFILLLYRSFKQDRGKVLLGSKERNGFG